MAKGGKWAFMRGKYPALPDDPTHGEVIAEARKKFGHMSLKATVAEWDRLLLQKANAKEVLAGIDAELVGIERVAQDYLEKEGVDSTTVEGVVISRKPEPNVKIADSETFMAWVAEFMPDIVSVHHSTIKSIVKAELDPSTRADKDGPPALPAGLDITLYEGIHRTGKPRAFTDEESAF